MTSEATRPSGLEERSIGPSPSSSQRVAKGRDNNPVGEPMSTVIPQLSETDGRSQPDTSKESDKSGSSLPQVPKTLEEQDAAVFGSTNEDLADALADYVKSAIEEAVRSLPLLKDPQKRTQLAEQIQKPYWKNIDLIEAYSKRNLFTLRALPPRHRRSILQALASSATTNDGEVYTEDPLHEDTGTGSSASPSTKPSPIDFQYPSKEKIPSQDSIDQLQNELAELKLQLQNATKHRNDLLVKSESLRAARSLSDRTIEVVRQPSVDFESKDLQEPIKTAVFAGQNLRERTDHAKKLQSQLQASKRERSTDNSHPAFTPEDSDLPGLPPRPRQKRKKDLLSMEEAYRQERRVVEANVADLSAWSSRLKQGQPSH